MLCRGCGILTLPAGTRCAQFCASARSEVCSGLYLTSGETGSRPPNLPAVTPGFRLLFNKIEEVISHPQPGARSCCYLKQMPFVASAKRG